MAIFKIEVSTIMTSDVMIPFYKLLGSVSHTQTKTNFIRYIYRKRVFNIGEGAFYRYGGSQFHIDMIFRPCFVQR